MERKLLLLRKNLTWKRMLSGWVLFCILDHVFLFRFSFWLWLMTFIVCWKIVNCFQNWWICGWLVINRECTKQLDDDTASPFFEAKDILLDIWEKLFNNLSFCAGLVLQPASEAEEDEVCGSRQHPLASALLPHKKSKFSILRTAFRGRPGETFEDIWYRKEVEFCLIKNRSKQVTSINALSMQEISEKGNTLVENKITKDLETRRATLRRQYCWTEFPFVVAIGNC